MRPLRLDDAFAALPALDELRPLRDHLLAHSVPDPRRRWAASGEVDVAGSRLIASGDWAEAARELAAREHEHLADVYGAALEAVACLERGDLAEGAAALLRAAAAEEARERPGRALAYASSAADVARTHGEPRLIALALRREGRAQRALGALREAERLYAAGHRLARDAGDVRGAAEGAIGAGNVLEQQGRWPEAEIWYRTALECLEPVAEPVPERWQALLNLHVVTRSIGRVEESATWLERAEEVARALGDATAMGLLENAWGQLEMARGDFAAAQARFTAALPQSGGAWARVNFRLNLGEALLAQGRTLDAAEEVREAERDALSTGVVEKLPEVYRLLGRIAAARGNPDAFVLFERALTIARERRLPPLEEALTLQAYAEAVREDDPERAGELLADAGDIYRRLGIPGTRAPWADSFGLARDLPDVNARDEETHDD